MKFSALPSSLFLSLSLFVFLTFFSACTPLPNGEITLVEQSAGESESLEELEEGEEKPVSENYLTAKILDAPFYDQAFAVAEKSWNTSPIPNARIVIVNHHLLAPHLIADTLHTVNAEEIENIILLSPNHFATGNSNILTTDRSWKTPFGFTKPLPDFAAQFAQDQTILQREHGVSGIIGFLHYRFPESRIIPILQKDTTSVEESQRLAQNIIDEFSTDNTLIVLSLDISHDLFPQISEFHDITTIESLKNFDIENFQRLDIDSIPSLRTTFEIAKQWSLLDFQVLHHTNSAEITNQKFQPDTTSYIAGYFQPVQKKDCAFIETEISCMQSSQNTQKATALFLGDMMFDRYIRETLDEKGWEYILDWRMKRFMRGSDITVVNFEGAMTDFEPYPAHDMMLSFTSDPKWASKMKGYGITLASLANNHSLNFGKEGLRQTQEYLNASDIETFGQPFNTENLSVIQNIRGMNIGFVGYHELFDGNPKPVLDEIEILKLQTDFIVVYAHWGDEYIQKIHPRPQQKAHSFIDAGADIVIGHHPHVVQPMEEYEGKYIFYSLGNFVFDQADYSSVRQRLGLGLVFECENNCKEKNISYTLFPLMGNKNHQVRLMNEKEQIPFFQWFERISQ